MTPKQAIASWVKDSLTAIDNAEELASHGHIDDRPDLVIRITQIREELEGLYRELSEASA